MVEEQNTQTQSLGEEVVVEDNNSTTQVEQEPQDVENKIDNAENTTSQNDTSVNTTQESQEVKETLSTKNFTQEQVNDIVRRRLEREERKLLDEYGVEDKTSLETLIGKAQSYDATYSLLKELQEEVKALKQEKLFNEENVNQERVEDIKAYFKGIGKDITQEDLKEQLKTHPEWLKQEEPKITITKLGSNANATHTLTEEEEAAKLFGLKSFRKKK